MQKIAPNAQRAALAFGHLLFLSSDFVLLLITFPYRSMRRLY